MITILAYLQKKKKILILPESYGFDMITLTHSENHA